MSKNICKVALLITLGMFGFSAIADTATTPPSTTTQPSTTPKPWAHGHKHKKNNSNTTTPSSSTTTPSSTTPKPGIKRE